MFLVNSGWGGTASYLAFLLHSSQFLLLIDGALDTGTLSSQGGLVVGIFIVFIEGFE